MGNASIKHLELEVLKLPYVKAVRTLEEGEILRVRVVTDHIVSEPMFQEILKVINSNVPLGVLVEISLLPTWVSKVKSFLRRVLEYVGFSR